MTEICIHFTRIIKGWDQRQEFQNETSPTAFEENSVKVLQTAKS